LATQKQNVSSTSSYENIKKLNSIIKPDGNINAFLKNVRATKNRIDKLLNEQRAKLESQKAAVVETTKRAEEVKDEYVEKHTEKISVVFSATETQNSFSDKKPVEKVEKVESVQVTKEEQLKETRKSEKNLVKAQPKQEQKVQEQKAQELKSKTTIVTPKINTGTTSSTYVPSYIKGKVNPPPKPVKVEKKPPFEKKRPDGQKDNNRPFKPNNASNNNQQKDNKPAQKPFLSKMPAPAIIPNKERRIPDKKKEHNGEDKKAMNKRTLIRKGFITENFDEDRMGTRKLKNKKVKEQPVFVPTKIEKAVITTENLTVKILSEKIGKTAQEIIKQLMILGIMTNINSVVDFPTMELVANELGVELELKLEQSKESIMEAQHDEADDEKDLVKRPPIITVMGHVDHGKTSLLDAIRKTSIAAGEAGGITQHIGAYSVTAKGEKITFLDTPGHEAFTEMRARGAQVTDIAILIVAADDGVMPQTIEAINHAKAANVPILVAINKIDKPTANIDRIKQQLTEHGLVPEEWGGDIISVPISAKSGEGIDKLLEMILFLAEYNNYRANPKRKAKGSIIEAKLDKGKGPIANVIVQNGTLKVGDIVVSGYTSGKIKAMIDDKGRTIKEASPSMPVSILGFTEVPSAGDSFYVVADEKTARQVIEERTNKLKNEQANQGQKVSLDDVFNKISEGKLKEFNLVIKADVQGSAEALKNSLLKITNEEVKLNVIHSGVGAINKSDLMLAEVSSAIIIGFGVRADAESRTLAEHKGIDIRLYNVIYEVLEDIEAAMKGMVTPKYKEVVIGRAQVRNVFKITNVGIVAGSYVLNGKIQRNAKARVYRDGEVVFTGAIDGLKRFKDDVKEVGVNFECGISIQNFNDIKENDEIEAYILEELPV